VLGHQGTGVPCPCPCCTTKRRDFGAPGQLHKAEAALPQMSEAHLSLLQTLHVPCNNLADDTIISIQANDGINTMTRPFIAHALEKNTKFVHFMSDPAEVFRLQQDGALSPRYCTFMRITLDEESNIDQSVVYALGNKFAAVVVRIMKRWSQIKSAACTNSSACGNKVEMERVLKTRGCFVVDGQD
jgi:hypothetical protein